ncbi:MAG: hypothetical protein M3T56_14355 [Chloroflexota bacterium]|nr:hypothetical protein [Chloroflexota bacterium]
MVAVTEPTALGKIRLLRRRIEPVDPIVTDRRRASLIRQQYLDNWPTEEGVAAMVDLNTIHVLSLSAADELIVKWLERARTRRTTLLAVLATFDREVKQTLDRALREGRQAAYYVRSSPTHEKAEIIGDVTKTQRDTLDALRVADTPEITAKGLSDLLNLQPNTANMRLTDLFERGLLLRDAARNGSTAYAYPRMDRIQLEPPD